MRKTVLKKATTMLLALVLLLSMSSITALAEELEQNDVLVTVSDAGDYDVTDDPAADNADNDDIAGGQVEHELSDQEFIEEHAAEPQTRDLQPAGRRSASDAEDAGGLDESNLVEAQIGTDGQWGLEQSRARFTQQNIPAVANVTGRLTTSNLQSQYSFSITGGTKAMYLQFLSGEHTYTLALFQFVPSANQYLFTGVQLAPSNTSTSIVNLPNGQYILAVIHNGWVGTDYNIRMNAANPAGMNRVFLSANLQTAVHSESDNSYIYINGAGYYIPSEYRRTSNISGSWGYDVMESILDQFAGFDPLGIVTYRVQNHGDSTFITSNNALVIRVGQGTSVFGHRSRRVTNSMGQVIEREFNFNDGKGQVTPRRLDWRDINDKNILIYCLDRQEFIDWAGPANLFARNRPSPTMTIVLDFDNRLRNYLG